MVSRLETSLRRNQNFRVEGGEDVEPEEGVTVDSIMVTKVPVHEDIEAEALEVLGDAINVSKTVDEDKERRNNLEFGVPN